MHKQATRIYLDSRYALPDGSFEIPGGGIECDPTDRVWLSEFSTVASWHTIDDTNRFMYVIEQTTPGVAAWNKRVIGLSTGPHDMDSLATDITTLLNGSGKHAAMGTYSCARVSGGIGGGAGGQTNKSFYITCTQGNFRLPNDDLIRSEYGVQGLTWSTNSLFSFQFGGEVLPGHRSGFVDLRRCHNIFLHCPGFGSHNCIGPRGSRNILAKIPVDVPYGQPVNLLFSGSDHDAIEAGVRAISNLRIELRDVHGNSLDLNGGHWSCTLIFER
jgi:hypothetical protein